jgi:hypothetical protein
MAMACLITFRTSRFDVTKETPNESNAFAGQGVLKWLRDELAKHQYESTVPDMEDWGWYIDVKGSGASYMVGASAEVEYKDAEGETLAYDATGNDVLDWTLQIHKRRTFVENLLGKNKMATDDRLCADVERIVKSDGSLLEVSVMRDAV